MNHIYPTTTRRYPTAVLFILLCSLVMSLPARAQPESRPPAIGVSGGYEGAFITGQPVTPCCVPEFDGAGFGSGFAVGGSLQLPLSSDLSLDLRARYSYLTGSLSTTENIGNALDGGGVVDATVEHSLDATIGDIGAGPLLSWYPMPAPLRLSIGVIGGLHMVRSYQQREQLLTPQNVSFKGTGGSRVRNRLDGTIEEMDRAFVETVVGIGYELPAGRSITLAPEVSYHLALTGRGTWAVDRLSLGALVSLKLAPDKVPEQVPPVDPILEPDPQPVVVAEPVVPEQPATIVRPAAEPAAPKHQSLWAINAFGLSESGAEQPIYHLRIEEMLGGLQRPLLNYLFFDDNSSELPSRYRRIQPAESEKFDIEHLHNLDALQTYYHLLNIVGLRMRANPDATITLVGCNSARGAERGISDVAIRRAENVRGYLRDVWNIPESRMGIKSRGLPEKASNVDDPDGIAENRRVEIQTDTWAILEPVTTTDTLRISYPSAIRFRPTVEDTAGVARWTVAVSQNGRVLKHLAGDGQVPEMLDWHVDAEQSSIPSTSQPIQYDLRTVDATGKENVTAPRSLPVEQTTLRTKRREGLADREIERYSLILFDFASAEITGANRKIIEYIRGRTRPGTSVKITGYGDRVGDTEYNLLLSRNRASTVAGAIDVPETKIFGAGESELFDNDLPEGRFYCRTVQLVLETPIRYVER